jgi:hypothetical protein
MSCPCGFRIRSEEALCWKHHNLKKRTWNRFSTASIGIHPATRFLSTLFFLQHKISVPIASIELLRRNERAFQLSSRYLLSLSVVAPLPPRGASCHLLPELSQSSPVLAASLRVPPTSSPSSPPSFGRHRFSPQHK